ncbi:PEPxxWA-CTERM sorting domain-containing protein [Sandaracinobacter sp. RS1-74]|nr:PEPxxWA-CTERM sorting domain-containing protein [Sandaracinobacteroides sayramensis]MCG2839812.1 PEPxxWA-CTERM sorting domain-containing protein [Sandaracinobacteroides sayramensis]
MFKFVAPLAALASFGLATAANAAVTISVAAGNLAEFSYTVDEATRTINIFETWDENTLNNVYLLIEGWPYGLGSWQINKYVTNNTGRDWLDFSHELLQSDRSVSPDADGLSFAQKGIPLRPRESDLFADVYADELSTRDFLKFSNGTVANGETVWFGFGITNRRDTADTNPFYLRQAQPGVPEPATWALLIAGFGMVGVSMRRRRAGIGSVTA